MLTSPIGCSTEIPQTTDATPPDEFGTPIRGQNIHANAEATDQDHTGKTQLKKTLGTKIIHSLECTGKPYLLKAQHSAFNIPDSTIIALTVQNLQITSFVPDSTDLVVDSSNKCLAVRTVGMQRCPGFHKNVSFAK